MNFIKFSQISMVITFGIFCMFGYSSASNSIKDYGQITTKVQPATTEVQIIKVSAKQEDETVVVEGLVRRQKEGKISLPGGCIDITVLDSHGKIVDKIFTKNISTGTYNGGYVETPFVSQIPIKAPVGSVVSVKFHNGSHRG